MRQGGLLLELTRLLRAALAAAVLPFAAAAAASPCAQADGVPAVDLVEPALLSGPLHTVRPCATLVGHLARFELDTRFGPLVADSIALLRLRVEELPAVERLELASVASTAVGAAGDAVERTVDTVARVAGSPIDSLAGLPEGALRFFRRRIDTLGERATALGDRAGDALTGADEVYDTVSVRPGVAPPAPSPEPWWRRGGRGVAGLAKDWIGYGKARRTFARRLGVDPYSTNPLLESRMDTLAWAAASGGKAAGLATAQLGGDAGSVLGALRRVDAMVWELPPEAVSARNHERLGALGCGDIELRRFLRNARFDPSLQTRLTDALVELQPARGCVDVLELAAALESELEVRYLVDAIALLAARGPTDAELLLVGAAPVLRIAPPPRDPAAPVRSPHVFDMQRREPGALERLAASLPREPRILLPLPVDRLQWTPETAAFFDDARFRVVDKTALVVGDATQNALQGLTRRGWEVAEGVTTP